MFVCGCGMGIGVWVGVGFLPVHNDIVLLTIQIPLTFILKLIFLRGHDVDLCMNYEASFFQTKAFALLSVSR